MSKQDLTAIDDKEFEILCCQLLSNELGARFERFKPGKDAGVDGRYFKEDKTEIVLQCKHWARSSISALLRSLLKTELPKVTKLKPARYLLATSMELNRADKQKIAAIFSGYMQSSSDVFGYEDICDLLSKYPGLYKEHPNLWLSSAEVIGLIENAAIIGRSAFTLSEIRSKAIRYVETTSHREAKARLEKLGTVLITGLPGIGKTTLADQLCLEYVLHNYELCVLGKSIEEVENVYKEDKRQIYYFDDFVGSNYLEALIQHDDSRIVGFINRVSKDPQKRFILTSRTTVLNQAKILSDRFAIAKIDRNEFEIKVESLEPIDRARILHKHIWYSDLSPEIIEQILSLRRYREIIFHKNFNPRLIQFITDAQRFDDPDPQHYWDYVKRTLTNPSSIWEHVFESQLDDFSRALLLLVAFNVDSINENDLRISFENFRREPIAHGYKGSPDFVRNIKLATGSVLNRNLGYGGSVSYTLFNPSITDYVLQRAPKDRAVVEAAFLSLHTLSSLRNLTSLFENKYISNPIALGVVEVLVSRKLGDDTFDVAYRIRLAQVGMKFINASTSIKESLSKFLSSQLVVDDVFDSWDVLGNVLAQGVQHRLVTPDQASRFFDILDRQSTIGKYEIDGMTELYEVLGVSHKSQLEPILRRHIIEFWEESISETVMESPEINDYFSEDDTREVEKATVKIVENLLDEYPFHFSTDEINHIALQVDSSDIIYQNQKSCWDRGSDDERAPPALVSSEDAIDELFNVDFPKMP